MALGGKRTNLVITCVLLFLGVHFFYYSVEAWMLSFMVGVNAVLFVMWLRSDPKNKSFYSARMTTNITIAFATVFLTYNQIIYSQFLPSAAFANIPKSAYLFVTSLSESIFGRGTRLEPYAILATDRLAFALNLGYSVLVAARQDLCWTPEASNPSRTTQSPYRRIWSPS